MWHSKSKTLFGISLIINIFVVTVCVVLLGLEYQNYRKIVKHVNSTANINCNNCHVGESFVNLFDHYVVRFNSKLKQDILIKSKLKIYP